MITFLAVLRKVVQRQIWAFVPTPTLIPRGSLAKLMCHSVPQFIHLYKGAKNRTYHLIGLPGD